MRSGQHTPRPSDRGRGAPSRGGDGARPTGARQPGEVGSEPASPTPPVEGAPIAAHGAAGQEDVDRTVRYQKALLEAEVEASIDGILVVSETGDILSHNRRFAEMWGLPPDVVQSGSDRVALAAAVWQIADPDAFRDRVDYLYAHPDEVARDEIALRDGRVFDRHSAPVLGPAGEHYGRVWFFRDVTAERRHADELRAARRAAEGALADLRQAQDRLVQQEKLAGLGRMASGIAHELQNPLNFVVNFADAVVEAAGELEAALAASPARPAGEALADATDALGDVVGNARRIAAHGRRAAGVVRAILDHTRVRPGRWEAVDVNALVTEGAARAADTSRRRHGGLAVDLELDLDPAAATVAGSADELGRAVSNLVSNALEAVAEHARREGAPRYTPRVVVRTRRRGARVEVAVEDNGGGLDEAARERLFEPFYTTKPPGHGNVGLGLALAREIVVGGHGGQLEADSGDGEGTRFIVTLAAHQVGEPQPVR